MTILIEKEYFLWQLQKNKFDRSSQKTTLIGNRLSAYVEKRKAGMDLLQS